MSAIYSETSTVSKFITKFAETRFVQDLPWQDGPHINEEVRLEVLRDEVIKYI